jgi:hypothetical protein
MGSNKVKKMRVVAVKAPVFEYMGPTEVTRIFFENQERIIRQLSDAEIERLLKKHPEFSAYFQRILKTEAV